MYRKAMSAVIFERYARGFLASPDKCVGDSALKLQIQDLLNDAALLVLRLALYFSG